MGEVYLAYDETLGREVAVKLLPPDSAEDVLVGRFMKEAQLCSQITHPNVITIHDVGRDGDVHYIVMQYVDGLDLRTMANEQGGRLPYMAALRLIRPAANGLHAAHEHKRGLIHRDIKPSNIMVGRDRQVYLMDFGLVREESASVLSSTGKVLGTPVYMSPEQCRSAVLDRRSDIYSLGATLYDLLTGERPARGRSNHELITHISGGARIPTVSELRPEIPTEVSDFVQRSMAFRKEDRFHSAEVMAQRISELLRSLQVDASDDSVPPHLITTKKMQTTPPEELVELVSVSPRSGWRHPAWLIGAALLVVVAVVSSLLTIQPDSVSPKGDVKPAPLITDGMINIDAGQGQLGSDNDKIREFLRPYVPDVTKLFIPVDPVRTTRVGAFWIDRYEVTQSEYAVFLKATDRTPPESWDGVEPEQGKADHPVVDITYEDAEAYANWAGKKLPTPEQWIRAFRGDKDWLFPWGDTYDATFANVGDNPTYPNTSPVDATPKDVSSFGVFNLVGNATEFVRGTVQRNGQTLRTSKGADWRRPGFKDGIGSNQTVLGTETQMPFLGFRCVVEDE